MKIETKIHLNKFKPRPYQLKLLDAVENKKFKKSLVIWPRRCLAGNTHILMADGSYKLLCEIEKGDKIIAYNGKDFVPDIVKYVWAVGKKDAYKVTSFPFLPLYTSYDHVFANKDHYTTKWDPLCYINPHAQLLQYPGLRDSGIHDPNLAEFIGNMIAHGIISRFRCPSYKSNDKEQLVRMESLVKISFNYRTEWSLIFGNYKLTFPNNGEPKNKIKDMFTDENYDIAESRRGLPKILWTLDKASILRFFAGLFTNEDYFHLDKKAIIIDCSTSEELVWGYYWLLRKINIIPLIPIADHNFKYKLKITGREVEKLLKGNYIYGNSKCADLLHVLMADSRYNQNDLTIKDGVYHVPFERNDALPIYMFDIETKKHHNFVANGYIVHNSGKDICCFNLLIRAALRKVGVYFYLLPTFSQARRVIFDSITNSGDRFIDYIPKELIANINSQEMKIKLTNNSIIQLLGSDTYDTSLVGTNPNGIIFSEYSLQDPRAFQFARPILTANDGFCVIISTPRGKNSLWELFQIAKHNPQAWFSEKLTVEDTGHISLHDIEKERAEGVMSEDLIQQEYYTSFEMGVEGAYYAKYIDRLHVKGQIGDVPWEAAFKVHVAIDIGVRDSTCLIFFQTIGAVVRIIDEYTNSKVGLEHYVSVIRQKPYVYGHFIAPHDVKVQEWGSGLTRIEKARQLGINFTIAHNVSIEDGIECVRSTLGKVWIDSSNCKQLIKSLENYRQEFDIKKQVYKPFPLHDKWSHFADAMRYLCISLPKTQDGLSAAELDRRYHEAVYGNQSNLPSIFRDDLPDY